VIGGLAGLRIFYHRFTADSGPIALLGTVVVAMLFGWLAWRYLDDFWQWLLRW
jgi:hypothetical protein